MSAPADLIERLDRALSEYGQDIVLQRLDTDTAGEQTVVYEAPCRAVVRAHYPQELDHIAFETLDTTVVLSPTDLVLAGWPEPIPAKDDRLLIAGRPNNVVTVSPIQVDGTLVRIDLTCRE
jgi:hypothetical protein